MKQSITIKLNAWIICAVLLIANLVTIGLWRPWETQPISSRTIAITGSTTIQAAPDQFVFTPSYQKQGTDKTKVNTELSKLSDTIVAKLKKLGVQDSAIKTDAYSYDYGIYAPQSDSMITANLNITVTIYDKTLAQKVQDYLATTNSTGSITPSVSFSSAKQKDLETTARTQALADAKTKAENSAKQLGVSLGRVVTVSDITSSGITPLPWMLNSGATKGSAVDSSAGSSTTPSYAIQPGLNDYSFSVSVTYELN